MPTRQLRAALLTALRAHGRNVQYALSLQQLRSSKQAIVDLFPSLEANSKTSDLTEKLAATSLSNAPTPRRPSSLSRASSSLGASVTRPALDWAGSLDLLRYPLSTESTKEIPQEAFGQAISAIYQALAVLLPDLGSQSPASKADFLSALQNSDGILGLSAKYKAFDLSAADAKAIDAQLRTICNTISKSTGGESGSSTTTDLQVDFGFKAFGIRCLLANPTVLETSKPEERCVSDLHKASLALCKGLVTIGD